MRTQDVQEFIVKEKVMNRPAVSIIMPIYNASKFLKESLGGLTQQTLKNIEIICVNDGSTDNSLDLMKRYAQADARIKIIDKANSGYGNTMNEGMKIATGEYIGILEPDDFADVEMYERLYSIAKEKDAEVVKSNYYEYSTAQDKSTFFEVLNGLCYDTVTSAEENERIIFMRPCIWSAIYKRELLEAKHIVFNETPGASYQDTAFAFKVWVSANRVVFVKDAFLNYRIDNENSSVKSSGKVFSICDEFQSMHAFLNESKTKKEKYIKMLQVLKLDSYTWNLNRIAPEFQNAFRDQIALEYIKADYENVLDSSYFDEQRWKLLQTYMNSYKEKYPYSDANKQSELVALQKRVYDLENSSSYKFGHAVMLIPGKILRALHLK